MKSIVRAAFRSVCFLQIVVTFFLSSLLVNAVQLLCFSLVCLGIQTRSSIAKDLSSFWWNISPFVFRKFFGVETTFYGKQPEKGKRCFIIANHLSGVDFLTSQIAFEYLGIPTGRVVGLLKNILKFMPGVGFINYFQGGVFIERNLLADKDKIERKISLAVQSEKRLAVALFPEGTRRSPEKLLASQEFARNKGLPVLQHVMIPRFNGFVLMVRSVRDSLHTLVDVTIAYDPYPVSIRDFIFGSSGPAPKVHVLIETFSIDTLPKEDEALKSWLLNRFVEKDKALTHFEKNKKFPETARAVDNKEHSASYVFFALLSGLFMYATGLIGRNGVSLWLFFIVVTLLESGILRFSLKPDDSLSQSNKS